ncbi:hypothetical protein [Paenibacillus agilis]|uniref:Peptidase C-terminal archaeal/bacterial domain-containing protein n=1 Tax=Paenibacillus agilis TaxID=3020863 RepID=A0A559J089_9BACL|nr:hypothetical protein [Paenibacillus agilis]TVX93294.1 hypothetical protein FPZ44_09625 [Paenibacillus agilis]
MKKKLVVLSTLATLLGVLPATQAVQAAPQQSVSAASDVETQAILLESNWYLGANGEANLSFNYQKSQGSTIRYWLGDDNNTDWISLTIKIYDSNWNQVATATTHNGQVLSTFNPTSDGTYYVKIVSSNGTGNLGYRVTVRAI